MHISKKNILVRRSRCGVFGGTEGRGKITALEDVQVKGFDAVVSPGGFGAAKNRFTLAIKDPD